MPGVCEDIGRTPRGVVVPFVLLVVAQIAGLYVMSLIPVVVFGAVLLLAGVILLRRIAPRFERETILKTL